MRNKILLFLLTFIGISQIAAASAVRDKYNFNSEWLLYVGDIPAVSYTHLTLPTT